MRMLWCLPRHHDICCCTCYQWCRGFRWVSLLLEIEWFIRLDESVALGSVSGIDYFVEYKIELITWLDLAEGRAVCIITAWFVEDWRRLDCSLIYFLPSGQASVNWTDLLDHFFFSNTNTWCWISAREYCWSLFLSNEMVSNWITLLL
jgi:hypothetical protein